jgi:hypothetical protein
LSLSVAVTATSPATVTIATTAFAVCRISQSITQRIVQHQTDNVEGTVWVGCENV